MRPAKPAWPWLAALVVLSLVGGLACGSDSPSRSTSSASTTNPSSNTAVACPSSATTQGPARAVPETTFRLGYVMSETGSLGAFSQPSIQGVKLAAQEVGQAGIQAIELLTGDSTTMPEVANNVADRHIADQVHGIVGASASSISLSIIDKLAAVGIPMVSPTNTALTFTTYDDGGYYFRTAVSDQLQGQVMATRMLDDGHANVAVLFRQDDYGRGFARTIEAELQASGATVVASQSYDPNGSTFQAEVQQLAAAGADAVALVTFEEGAKILAQMIEAGIGPQDIGVYIADGLATEDLWAAVAPDDPTAVAGIIGMRPAPSRNSEATFAERYRAFAPQEDDLFAAHGYDAAIILLLAALSAESNNPADYTTYINDITRCGRPCDQYAECAQLLQDGYDIDYNGASGPLDFIDAGEPSEGSYNIVAYNANQGFDILEYATARLS